MRIKRILITILIFCLHLSLFIEPVSTKGIDKFKTYSYEEVKESVGYITLSSKNAIKHVSTAYIIYQDDTYSYVATSAVTSSSGYDKKLHIGSEVLDITLVGKDEVIDLAIFKFEKEKYDAAPLKLASSTSLLVGESVYFTGLIGFSSYDDLGNVKTPIFSKQTTYISKLDVLYCPNNYLYNCSNLMLLDTRLSSMSQGGPILNAYGYVVGMVTMNNPIEEIENSDKMYHATFSSDLNIFLNRILNKNNNRADLGLYIQKVENLSVSYQNSLNIQDYKKGTIITSMKDNASLSGIGTEYVIVKINDKKVKTTKDLISEMYKYNSGTIIRVTAKKTNGKLKTYYIKS